MAEAPLAPGAEVLVRYVGFANEWHARLVLASVSDSLFCNCARCNFQAA